MQASGDEERNRGGQLDDTVLLRSGVVEFFVGDTVGAGACQSASVLTLLCFDADAQRREKVKTTTRE
jgi:hypothetical protein